MGELNQDLEFTAELIREVIEQSQSIRKLTETVEIDHGRLVELFNRVEALEAANKTSKSKKS